jgi:hypothetical protein
MARVCAALAYAAIDIAAEVARYGILVTPATGTPLSPRMFESFAGFATTTGRAR